MLLVLLGILTAAALLGAGASRKGFSPWWTLLLAAATAAIALSQRADAAECGGRDSAEAVFAYATLGAVGLFTTAALTALFDAVRFARSGRKGLAAVRLVPLLLGVALAFGTFVLWVATLVSCLS